MSMFHSFFCLKNCCSWQIVIFSLFFFFVFFFLYIYIYNAVAGKLCARVLPVDCTILREPFRLVQTFLVECDRKRRRAKRSAALVQLSQAVDRPM